MPDARAQASITVKAAAVQASFAITDVVDFFFLFNVNVRTSSVLRQDLASAYLDVLDDSL